MIGSKVRDGIASKVSDGISRWYFWTWHIMALTCAPLAIILLIYGKYIQIPLIYGKYIQILMIYGKYLWTLQCCTDVSKTAARQWKLAGAVSGNPFPQLTSVGSYIKSLHELDWTG